MHGAPTVTDDPAEPHRPAAVDCIAEPGSRRSELLARAREQLSAPGSVILTGPAGIGKSTLLTTLAGHPSSTRVLRCSPAEADRHLPFLGLIDLFATVGEAVLGSLPDEQRAALDRALLRRTARAGDRDALGLRLAVLTALRALCGRSPVLLVVDDVQWLDPPSADLLAFLARRTGELPLRTLVSVRTGDGTAPRPQADALCRPPVLRLDVPPMTAGEIGRLLSADPGRSDSPAAAMDRRALTEMHRASGGNPFFALEIGHALARRDPVRPPAGPLPVPDNVRHLLLGRLRTLSPRTRSTLLVAAVAARPTPGLLRRAGREHAVEDLADAGRGGIVTAGEPVRFAHPLLATVLAAEATDAERLAAHAALARAADDPAERARHLAAITPGKNARLCTTLVEAASVARGRGAPGYAASLLLLAAERTPDQPREARLRLDAADDARAAGEFALARSIADAVLEHATDPGERVRAALVIIDSCGQGLAEFDGVFPQALADAGDDPALLAQVRYRLAWRAWLVHGSLPDALAEAATAASLADRVGDRHTEVLALSKKAFAELQMGRKQAAGRTLATALSRPQDTHVMFDHNGPVYTRCVAHMAGDRLDEARAELSSLIHAARRRGALESLSLFLYTSSRVETARGRCRRGLEVAQQCLRLATDSELSQGPAWCAVAFAEAAGGSTERAVRAARLAVGHSEDDNDLAMLAICLHALGHAGLLGGDVAGALAALRRARRLDDEQGIIDPALRPWHADLAEALIASGAAAEAEALIAVTADRAGRLGRRGVAGALARAEAHLLAARGETGAAAGRLEHAASVAATLGYPLDRARARLDLGRLLLRCGDVGGAGTALRDADRTFARAGAHPWSASVATELDRLDAPPGSAHAGLLETLTGTERRVASLVLAGATNKEIAGRLHISVKTVEAALTRVYRRLHVRSRVDLARLASTGRPR